MKGGKNECKEINLIQNLYEVSLILYNFNLKPRSSVSTADKTKTLVYMSYKGMGWSRQPEILKQA